MRKLFGSTMGAIAAIVVVLSLSGCGYNDLQRQDEQIKSAWSEVLNQYQRRADLVPNLVATVKGYAAQEQQVLTEVTNARASVGSIKATPELINDPAAFAKFQAAICRRSWKAPKTASRWPATGTSSRCRSTTPRCAHSRPT
jgi:hypothetical protein